MDTPVVAIFDMDGVIVDSNPPHQQAWDAFLEKHQMALSQAEYNAHVYGKTNHDILAYLREKGLPPADNQRYIEEKETLYQQIYADDIHAVAGLPQFLEALNQAHIPCWIATSAPAMNVDFVLSHTRLRPYFQGIVDETQVTHGKPDPQIYRITAEKANVSPAQCVVFEDSFAGVQAALGAGMHVVAVTTSHTAKEFRPNTPHSIADFTEMTLERLEQVVQLPPLTTTCPG